MHLDMVDGGSVLLQDVTKESTWQIKCPLTQFYRSEVEAILNDLPLTYVSLTLMNL